MRPIRKSMSAVLLTNIGSGNLSSGMRSGFVPQSSSHNYCIGVLVYSLSNEKAAGVPPESRRPAVRRMHRFPWLHARRRPFPLHPTQPPCRQVQSVLTLLPEIPPLLLRISAMRCSRGCSCSFHIAWAPLDSVNARMRLTWPCYTLEQHDNDLPSAIKPDALLTTARSAQGGLCADHRAEGRPQVSAGLRQIYGRNLPLPPLRIDLGAATLRPEELHQVLRRTRCQLRPHALHWCVVASPARLPT